MTLKYIHQFNLQPHNTLSIPAVAEQYVAAQNIDELKQALQFAKQNDLSVLLLGGGSNVVLPDYFPGLVIKITIQGIATVREDAHNVWLQIGAGVIWHELVEFTLQQGYSGIENLSLIPGTVGAAPMQNIGAYGVELESVFDSLTALDRDTLQVECLNKVQCEFAYRDSVFKGRARGRYVIVSVTLCLNKQPRLITHYPALREALSAYPERELTPKIISATVCGIRRQKLPDPNQIPNAGSFFKNPIIDLEQLERLRRRYPDVVFYEYDNSRVKIAAAWLLDRAGWRGYVGDGVGVHSRQALVLTNNGARGSRVLLDLASRIQEDVQAKFGIVLETEPEIISAPSIPAI